MKQKGKYDVSRKYLLQMLMMTTGAMLLVLTISSFVLSYNAEKTALDMNRNANQKVMSQIHYNLNSMNEIIKNLAASIYYNVDIQPRLTSQNENMFEIISNQLTLDRIVGSSSFVHSIVLYNANLNAYYAGGNMNIRFNDGVLLDRMRKFVTTEAAKVRKMELIPVRSDSSPEGQVDIFSFFMYDTLGPYNENESALILNVSPDWLIGNLQTLNQVDANQNGHIVILDRDQAIVASDLRIDSPDKEKLKNMIYANLHLTQAKQRNYVIDSDKQYLISFLNADVNDWIIVQVQPYEAILGKVDQLRLTSIIVTLVFLVLAARLFWFVSYKLYKPVQSLVRQTQTFRTGENDPGEDGEFAYISRVYRQMTEEYASLRKEQSEQVDLVRQYYLKRLVTDSHSFPDEDRLKTELADIGFPIDFTGHLLIGLLRIGQYRKFAEMASYTEQSMIKFAIANISREIVSGTFPCEIVDMGNDRLALLIGIGNQTFEAQETAVKLIRNVQEVFLQYYKIPLSGTLSDPIAVYRDISKHYNLTLQYSMYRLNYGRLSVIVPKQLASNLQNEQSQIPPVLEKKLVESIKANHLAESAAHCGKILDFVSGFNYDNTVQAIHVLFVVIKNTLKEMNANKLQYIPVDLNTFMQEALQEEDMDDIKSMFADLLEQISEAQSNVNEDKNQILHDTIKAIIERDYRDTNLSLQGIASMLKMSPVYIGRIFKKSASISIAEYINEVRLNKSLELLRTKSGSIMDIMEQVGYSNPSYYFKLFKKKFGTTPKDYRLKKVLP